MKRASLRKLAALVTLVAASAVLTTGLDGSAQAASSTVAHVCPPVC